MFSRVNGETLVFGVTRYMFQDVQFADPSVTVKFDVDPKAAAARRKLAFADAARNGYLVALDHVYFPASDMFKKRANTLGGFRCHTLTITKSALTPREELGRRWVNYLTWNSFRLVVADGDAASGILVSHIRLPIAKTLGV